MSGPGRATGPRPEPRTALYKIYLGRQQGLTFWCFGAGGRGRGEGGGYGCTSNKSSRSCRGGGSKDLGASASLYFLRAVVFFLCMYFPGLYIKPGLQAGVAIASIPLSASEKFSAGWLSERTSTWVHEVL